ncbi:MAG: hypothetical protein AB7P40_10570 [Chloroflexota bacterium]
MGCLLGCLAAFIAVSVLVVIVFAAGVFMFRRAFPSAESFGEASACTAMRAVISIMEIGLNQGDMSSSERSDAEQVLRELRSEFDRNCSPAP